MEIKLPKATQFLFEPADYKVLYGGRDSAKTTSVIIALLVLSMKEKARVLCCREFQNSLSDSIKPELDKWIDALGIRYFYTSTNNSIVGLNGTEFLFHGLRNNITKIKSIGDIKYCYIEEAETISQRSWEVLLPTIRIEGSETFIVFNPYLETDPTYVEFIKNQKPNSIVKKINYYDNPFLSEKSKRAIEYLKVHDYQKYLHIYEGEFIDQSETRVFTNWQIGEVKEPNDGMYYYAMDFGFSDSDPTAIVKCCIHEDTKELHIFEEVYEYKIEIDHLSVLIDSVPGAKTSHIIADSSRPETISFLKRQGYYILPSIKGAGSILEGVEFLRCYKIIVHPKCKNTQYELAHYSYTLDQRTGLKVPDKFEDKYNHLIDALRYSLERYRKNSREFNITVIG